MVKEIIIPSLNPALEVKCYVIGQMQVNSYLLTDLISGESAIIDPATDCHFWEEKIKNEKLNIKYIFNTHGHWDHIIANSSAKKVSGGKIVIHKNDVHFMKPEKMGNALKMGIRPMESKPDIILNGGETFYLGETPIKAIATPGHSAGGVCYLTGELLFAGDTLFAQSVGRTDLETGDFNAIIKSIKEKLIPLGDNVQVFPGHGDFTNIRKERLFNQFLQ